MSRTLNETALSTPNARKNLAVGIHWRGINADVHLGYRKQKRGGRWLVRWYRGEQKYKQTTIGTADDGQLAADGVNCLSFEQAKLRAAKTASQSRSDEIASADGPAPTVTSAIEAYVSVQAGREEAQRGKRGLRGDARLRLTRHVLSKPLAKVTLHALAERDLTKWSEGMPADLAKSTVRRIRNDLRAALNAAAAKHRARLPAEIVIIIKNGLRTSEAETPTARDKSALPDVDIRRIIDAAATIDERGHWEGDLLRLILVLSATGARLSQIGRMMVGDVQIAQNRLMVPTSRKGRGVKKASHIAIRVGTDVMAELRPAIAGRRSKETLLERWRHHQVKDAPAARPRWERLERGGWRSASELTRPWQDVVRLAGLPADTVPYSLRHSSIVRQLRAGLPVRLVAALHDTSTRMIESHYAAAIVDALDDLSAGAVIPLMSNPGEKVVALRAG